MWPWPCDPQKLNVSSACPVDQLWQFAAKSVHSFSNYTASISLSGLVLRSALSETDVTHRPQAVIIVGIYMSSNIYHLLLLYLSRKDLCRRIGLQTFKRDIFEKVSWLDVCKLLVCITPFSFSIIIIWNIWGCKCPR